MMHNSAHLGAQQLRPPHATHSTQFGPLADVSAGNNGPVDDPEEEKNSLIAWISNMACCTMGMGDSITSKASPFARVVGNTHVIMSIINMLVTFTFWLVLFILHVNQVHKGECTGTMTICTQNAGVFRALNFSTNTRSLRYARYPAGAMSGYINTLELEKLDPWPVVIDTTTATGDPRLATALATQCQDIPSANFSTYALERCKAERINTLWEIPNHREYISLSGGVHIVYLFLVTLVISMSFHIITFPSGVMPNGVKMGILFTWYFIGITFTVLPYLAPRLLEMPVPANNVVLAIILQIFTVLVHILWTVDAGDEGSPGFLSSQLSQGNTSALNGNTGSLANGNPPHSNSAHHHPHSRHAHGKHSFGSVLSNMMRLQPSGTTGTSYTNMQGKATNGFNPTKLGEPANYNLAVLESKLDKHEILEPFLVEMALTMPLTIVMLFAVGHRNTFDFFLQSFYSRTFMAFSLLAIVSRIGGLRASKDIERSNNLPGVFPAASTVVSILVVGYMVGWMLYDWYRPIHLTTAAFAELGGLRGAHSFVLGAYIIICIIFAFSVITPLLDNLTYLTVADGMKHSTYMSFTNLLQGLALLLRVYIFVYIVNPHWWYGAYEPTPWR